MRRLPVTISSSVTTVMRRGCDSSTLYLPGGTSVKANFPSASVSPATPSSSTIFTFTRRIGVFFSRSSTTPSKLIWGPAFTICSRMVNAYLYVIFTGAGWLSISAASNTNCLAAATAAASKSGPAPFTTSTSPT